MRRLLKILIAVAVVIGVGAALYRPAVHYLHERNRPKFRFAEVRRGKIMLTVNATGTVKPVMSVEVGSFVSGPVVELLGDFNQRVKKGQLLARVDPRLFEAAVKRDKAILATRIAEVKRVQALLKQAINDEKRALALRAENEDYISDAEMDRYRYNRESLEAQLEVAKAAVEQARANLENSMANLHYTEITAPVDGVIIDRKIEPGQTLAAAFQTPQLFVIAPDLEKEIYVFAAVDEADIGLIRKAQETEQPVWFTVDAYPDELFKGKIKEIRMSPQTIQNVVTYPVVVSAPNPELKLLPGMTANITFQIEEKADVIKIPNAALRFYPKPEYVRPEDRKILEGVEPSDEQEEQEPVMTALERAEAGRNRDKRHVWVLDGELLRAVEVVTGISDTKFTELVEGQIKEGDKLVTGVITDE